MTRNLLIINANFYDHISNMLIEGAITEIKKHDDYSYELLTVAGALEIPMALSLAISSNKHYDGFVLLGCVIRGGTTHYDMVCHFAFQGIQQLSLQHNLPVGYGILTVENEAQAIERADPKQKNKGKDATLACIELINLKEHFG